MEEIAKAVTINISHGLEIIAAMIIGAALIRLVINYFGALGINKIILTAEESRVRFGSSVAVALEILLGADVLATAVAPSWNDIGKLAAIAVLRTALNYFLGKELKEIDQQAVAEKQHH